MSYTKLTKKAVKKDADLQRFILNKPDYTKTITIAPNAVLWEKFTEHVKRRAGSKKVSRMTNYLVFKWLQTAKPEIIPEWSSVDAIVVTLSVDHEVWGDFMNKLREMYSKHKIQSDILNGILQDYLGNE